ncbi:zinc finger CCCH domain-containing protein 3 isoform X2 [Monodelphis domestica]|uniref:zinc finger CCCH domain-containing protein 3 isoform X2 n=1 Tax=Monodelphis domestica TaxID=13616 RepID=UPI0007B40D97|nr:zinc finger CCCH domain-containing protein 3 isoform X2 [Monodelphis domestica]
MEEKEQLRRQIRLLQGLIDDYKNLHGNAPASSTTQWHPSTYSSGRVFGPRYSRPGRRGFPPHHGPSWRKKYSLVNRPSGSMDQPGDNGSTSVAQPSLSSEDSQDPSSQHYVLERQVQLNSDQNMVIKIKPPPKSDSLVDSDTYRASVDDNEGSHRIDQRPKEGEGDPPGGKLQGPRPTKLEGSSSKEDPLLVCLKEPGKPRVVRSMGITPGGSHEPRRTVSESAIVLKSKPTSFQSPRSGLGRKLGCSLPSSLGLQHSVSDRDSLLSHTSSPTQAEVSVTIRKQGHSPKQVRENCLLVPCRTNKFRKNNYRWVNSSVKNPRAIRRYSSPRTAPETSRKVSFGTYERAGKSQLRADLDTKSKKASVTSKPGTSTSKYKWKASSPASSSSSSFLWHSEPASRDRPSHPSAGDSRTPILNRAGVGASGLKTPYGEAPLSPYKVKSRTKIIRRRGSTSLPVDKKSSPSSSGTPKNHYSLRRRNSLRGKVTPVLKRTPNKGLVQITKHRLCRLQPSRSTVPAKEAPALHALRTSPSNKVIKTRYRIVKKNFPSSFSLPAFNIPSSTWKARRLTASRLNRMRQSALSGKAQTSPPTWKSKGYRCIGGVMYRVSANKLSKTSGRPQDGNSKHLLRGGRSDGATSSPSYSPGSASLGRGSSSRSIASRAIQRSLAIIRQARQKKEKKRDYCMYYNRFGKCNRGQHCPYIHDPEKVAVCTRFLRGTCKKTDGTCPFSHHVSKEKMPVCSYFLKGICNNSNCPYSHVYVSKKAEVCVDFLKGYCPMGEKCKKKHMLLCPDFSRKGSCPRGLQCQLLHRPRKRLNRRSVPPHPPETSDSPTKWKRVRSAAPRKYMSPKSQTRNISSSSSSSFLSSSSASSSASSDAEDSHLGNTEASGSRNLSKLPSYISLQSSSSPRGHSASRARRKSPAKEETGYPWRTFEPKLPPRLRSARSRHPAHVGLGEADSLEPQPEPRSIRRGSHCKSSLDSELPRARPTRRRHRPSGSPAARPQVGIYLKGPKAKNCCRCRCRCRCHCQKRGRGPRPASARRQAAISPISSRSWQAVSPFDF